MSTQSIEYKLLSVACGRQRRNIFADRWSSGRKLLLLKQKCNFRKANKWLISVTCAWRSIGFEKGWFRVRLSFHRISIVDCLRRNRHMTKCRDEVHSSQWKRRVQPSWEDLQSKRNDSVPSNSILECRRSTTGDWLFAHYRENIYRDDHLRSCLRERRSSIRRCVEAKDRNDERTDKRDCCSRAEVQCESTTFVSIEFDDIETLEEDRWHCDRTLAEWGKKDPGEWSTPLDDFSLSSKEFSVHRDRVKSTRWIENNSSQISPNVQREAMVPMCTKEKNSRSLDCWRWRRRTRSEKDWFRSFAYWRDWFGKRTRASPIIRICLSFNSSIFNVSMWTKRSEVFNWKTCPTFKWIFIALVNRSKTFAVSLHTRVANSRLWSSSHDWSACRTSVRSCNGPLIA